MFKQRLVVSGDQDPRCRRRSGSVWVTEESVVLGGFFVSLAFPLETFDLTLGFSSQGFVQKIYV